MEWSNGTGISIGAIKPVSVFERMLVECDDRIDGRALLVESSDAVEISLNQLSRGKTARFERGMDVINRRLRDLKCFAAPLCMARRRNHRQQCG
jgi:hypothetical protein